MIIRYADDFVCAFQFREDAIKFFNELPKRLGNFKLEVAPEKTGLMSYLILCQNLQAIFESIDPIKKSFISIGYHYHGFSWQVKNP